MKHFAQRLLINLLVCFCHFILSHDGKFVLFHSFFRNSSLLLFSILFACQACHLYRHRLILFSRWSCRRITKWASNFKVVFVVVVFPLFGVQIAKWAIKIRSTSKQKVRIKETMTIKMYRDDDNKRQVNEEDWKLKQCKMRRANKGIMSAVLR